MWSQFFLSLYKNEWNFSDISWSFANGNIIGIWLSFFFDISFPFLISVLSSYLCAIINLFIRIMHSPRYVLYNSDYSLEFIKIYYVSVQALSHVQLFVTPRTVAHQASLSITNAWSLLKLMSIKSVMPSNHLILCCPLLLPPSIFPASGSFQMSQFFTSGGQSIGVSASASVLPMNIQNWFPLGLTGWISLQSKGLVIMITEAKLLLWNLWDF